jgi:hypothetical protein
LPGQGTDFYTLHTTAVGATDVGVRVLGVYQLIHLAAAYASYLLQDARVAQRLQVAVDGGWVAAVAAAQPHRVFHAYRLDVLQQR